MGGILRSLPSTKPDPTKVLRYDGGIRPFRPYYHPYCTLLLSRQGRHKQLSRGGEQRRRVCVLTISLPSKAVLDYSTRVAAGCPTVTLKEQQKGEKFSLLLFSSVLVRNGKWKWKWRISLCVIIIVSTHQTLFSEGFFSNRQAQQLVYEQRGYTELNLDTFCNLLPAHQF